MLQYVCCKVKPEGQAQTPTDETGSFSSVPRQEAEPALFVFHTSARTSTLFLSMPEM